jgi:hypothetical protein
MAEIDAAQKGSIVAYEGEADIADSGILYGLSVYSGRSVRMDPLSGVNGTPPWPARDPRSVHLV